MTELERQIGRRNFIKAAATLPAAGALLWKATSLRPVRAGIIGAGGQGRVLMEMSDPNFLKLVAVCDILPVNLQKGLDIAKSRHDPEARGYSDYKELLDRKDIEAVLIASPLWLHGRMTTDALAAGKHVLVEKTMAYSLDDCRSMIAAAKSAGKNLQVGHQRNYNPLYHEAAELIRQGTIGDVYHVRAVWHRNGDWRRKIQDPSFDPRPWGYDNVEHLTNWRLYDRYSRGLLAELASHQLQVVNWFSGRVPTAVTGTGGIHRYNDGREVYDHIYALFEYPENLTVAYSSIQSNAYDHYYEEFMGTKGTIVLRGETEALLFSEGGGNRATELDVKADAGGPVLEASESRMRDAAGRSVSGAADDAFNSVQAYRLQIEGFCRTIRNGEPNLCDGESGMNAAAAILRAHDAIRDKKRVPIAPGDYLTTD